MKCLFLAMHIVGVKAEEQQCRDIVNGTSFLDTSYFNMPIVHRSGV